MGGCATHAFHKSAMAMSPRTIAIVDDDLSVRRAVSRLLKTAGMSTICYSSGLVFLNRFKRDKPDCVLLDLQMPEISGMDVLQYLDNANISVPTIIVSAHGWHKSPGASVAAGVLIYLPKPLDADQLLRAVYWATKRFATSH